jgi:1-acyl-sn-glycerol-3-phosphate acyltransferase
MELFLLWLRRTEQIRYRVSARSNMKKHVGEQLTRKKAVSTMNHQKYWKCLEFCRATLVALNHNSPIDLNMMGHIAKTYSNQGRHKT